MNIVNDEFFLVKNCVFAIKYRFQKLKNFLQFEKRKEEVGKGYYEWCSEG